MRFRHQVRIQDFAKRASFRGWKLRIELDLHEWAICSCNPESWKLLGFNAEISNILETLFLSFLTSSSIPETDKNSTLHCTSINFEIYFKLLALSQRDSCYGYTEVCRGAWRYTQVHRGMWRGVWWGVVGYVEGYAEVYRGVQRCTDMCQGV